MKVSWALPLLAIQPLVTLAYRSGCPCTYGQPCWPSASAFSELQFRVSQPLIYPTPTAEGCYPHQDPSGNCSTIMAKWGDGNWRSSNSGSMEAPNLETFTFPNGTIDACYLNTNITGTCGQGSVPVIGVDARSVEDIQAAVNFAVEHDLRLVVKNTGHDYLGRSTARGSFMVWTHNMKDITYNSTFVPQGGPANETYEAVTLGAGVQWGEAYAVVSDYGRTVVGASAYSVGTCGGWVQGGGHSPLSPKYGLGVDNAVEITVVLSTGEFLTVNKYQNYDLYWALRGGGGSTCGIVTSVTYVTHLSVQTCAYEYWANFTNPSVATTLVGGLLKYQEEFTRRGWGGSGTISKGALHFTYYGPNMTNETATTTTAAWRNYTASLTQFGVVFWEKISCASSWYPLYQELSGNSDTDGHNTLVTSRLLSFGTIKENFTEVAQLLVRYGATIHTVGGGKVDEVPEESAGLNPEWRKTIVVVVCAITWLEGTSWMGIQALISQLQEWISAMYHISPNDGVYINEASQYEIDSREAFYGSHYLKLKAIKNKYDPHRLFVVAEGVGSEDWNEDLTCRY